MNKNTRELWSSCQKYFRENIPGDDYARLFSHVELETFEIASNTLVLCVPSQYICDTIENDNKLFDIFRKAIQYTFGRVRLKWHIVMKEDTKSGLTIEGPEALKPDLDSNLNRSQTFRTFVEGDSNRLSRSVGLRIAEHPAGTQFNPLFVYGPSGCGKTHLVNAIGNRCKEIYIEKRILYVSAQMFQQQFTQANMKGEFNDFISFYQTIDMLIVDDVQEWMTATKTQNAFFHIFNHLSLNGKRIILVSDRAPVELEGMHKRLLSRFKSGMMAEMEQPNVQLCIDILHNKMARDGIKISEDVVRFIAETANNSIRELEGIINSLMAYSVVYNCNIDMKLVERVVRRAVKVDNMPLTVDDVIETVCRFFDVTPNAVKGMSRKKEVVVPRQVVMYLANKYTNLPAARIGKLVGGRDHSTVLHSINKVSEMIEKDKSFAALIAKVDDMLKVKKS